MSLESRVETNRIPKVLLADLAGCYASDASSWLRGRPVESSKAARLEAALTQVEDLIFAYAPLKIDLTSTANVKTALALMAEHRSYQIQAVA